MELEGYVDDDLGEHADPGCRRYRRKAGGELSLGHPCMGHRMYGLHIVSAL